MRFRFLFLFVFTLVLLPFINAQRPVSRCSTSEFYKKSVEEHPEILEKVKAIENFTENWIKENKHTANFRAGITIPVVIHVVYRTPAGNISNEQIDSQIDVLNKDYQATNDEIVTVASGFQDDIANVGLEFCLAKRDPNGNATSGITRVQTNKMNIGNTHDIFHAGQGGADAWDEAHYLNIWVTELSAGYLGYAKYPGTAAPGEDGAVISFLYFGTTGVAADSYPYNKGRTVTHEIGHYFNLLHVWGESEDCSSSDHVVDTPSSSESYIGTCPFSAQFSCGSQDMHMDFMYYTDDACLGMFSKGQKARMMAALNGPRAGLLASNGCQLISDIPVDESTISIYPNPSFGQLIIDFDTLTNDNIQINLYDIAGKIVKVWTFGSSDFISLDVSDFPRGLYFLKLQIGGAKINKKVVLQ